MFGPGVWVMGPNKGQSVKLHQNISGWGRFEEQRRHMKVFRWKKVMCHLVTCTVLLTRMLWFMWGFPSFPSACINLPGCSCLQWMVIMWYMSDRITCVYVIRRLVAVWVAVGLTLTYCSLLWHLTAEKSPKCLFLTAWNLMTLPEVTQNTQKWK